MVGTRSPAPTTTRSAFGNLATGETKTTLQGHTDAVNAMAVTSDGRHAVSGSDDNTLRVWDLESGKELATFTGESEMHSCVVAPDGQTVITGD
jgi:WD40 repeat protein